MILILSFKLTDASRTATGQKGLKESRKIAEGPPPVETAIFLVTGPPVARMRIKSQLAERGDKTTAAKPIHKKKECSRMNGGSIPVCVG